MDTLYQKIGAERIERAITEFYVRAFQDPIIGHFFFNHDREILTQRQIQFASRMLGSDRAYTGKSVVAAHRRLDIRPAHFGRRQVLMKQVALSCGIDTELVNEWMRLEEQLRSIIVKSF